MRVLFVIGSLDIGGAEIQLVQLVRGLTERGHQVAVFCMEAEGALAPVLATLGVEVKAPGPIRRLGGWPGRIQRYFFRSRPYREFLRKIAPDVVHAMLPHAYVFAGAWTPHRIPLVYSRLSLPFYQTPEMAADERRLFVRTSAFIENAPANLAALRLEGASEARFHLVPNGLDVRRIGSSVLRDVSRARLGLAADELVLASVANLHAYKGHKDALRALSVIGSMLGQWCWICAGRDAGSEASLRAAIAASGVAARVRLLGLRSDVPDILSASDIFIHPSHTEGLSNAVLEAMGSGVATIATDVGGTRTIVCDGQTGLLVPANTPEALAKAILRLAQEPALRRSLGAAARADVLHRFSVDACCQRHESAYFEAISTA